jgi:hypothetical protein
VLGIEALLSLVESVLSPSLEPDTALSPDPAKTNSHCAAELVCSSTARGISQFLRIME